MKKTVLAIMCSIGTLYAHGTNNDSGTEENNVAKDYYYYTGSEKVHLNYDPTTVVVFDFDNTCEINKRKQQVMNKYPGISINRQLEPSSRYPGDEDILVCIYNVKHATVDFSDNIPYLRIMSCYTNDEGLQLSPDGYINVVLRKADDFAILRQCADNFNLEIVGVDDFNPLWYVLRITPETTMSSIEIANIIYETDMFAISSPSFTFDSKEISYDTNILEQWGLYNKTNNYYDISVSEAWGYATGRGIFNKLDSHGTHCAGIVAAVRNNNLQVCGVAPDAELVPIRIETTGKNPIQQLANAFKWACKNGIDVISCSWSCDKDSLVINAINAALYQGRNGKGCVVIKSSGDNGEKNGQITFPGNYNHDVISVGAIKSNGVLDEVSSYGEYLFVCAPGNLILSTTPNNNISYWSGTSMAAPHVAGVAALILSRNPDLTMKQVKEIIGRNTNDISTEKQTQKEFGMWDPKYGYGLVDAAKCVKVTPRKE